MSRNFRAIGLLALLAFGATAQAQTLNPPPVRQSGPQPVQQPGAPQQMPAPVAVPGHWTPSEQTKTYPVSGTSPIALYSSIGERGPKVGQKVRAIAHTDFKLTWTRKYEPQPDGSCRLTTAVPKLLVIYTLPRPAAALPPDLQARWKTFIDGVTRHERVHGEMIVDLTRQIEAASLGLSLPDDRSCAKVRAALQTRIGEIFPAFQQRNRDFDKRELSDGGAVHSLILQFVNQR